jgi:hypothetical protein
MAEMVLPGVYIEVRPEGLIVPGRISVGTIGIVGTASKGPVGAPVVLSGAAEAREVFGDYDAWTGGTNDELTLVRALELAYRHGATNVVALRVSGKAPPPGSAPLARAASRVLDSAGGECVNLTARWPGTWGDGLAVQVTAADEDPFVEDEEHGGGAAITLDHSPVVNSARTRVRHFDSSTGVTTSLQVIYDDTVAAPTPGQVKITLASGALEFGSTVDAGDEVSASYAVDRSAAAKVTVRRLRGEEVLAEETYTVASGDDLVADVTSRPSALVRGATRANSGEVPAVTAAFASFSGGNNGEAAADTDYREGFDILLNEDAHIMVAAGQDDRFGDDLDAHCQTASTDTIRRDRIAVVGSGVGATLDQIRGHSLSSDRVIFVAPGIMVGSDALPGAYAAAAVAGLLAGSSPHVSPTNKTLRVDGLTQRYTTGQLTQLLQSRVLALEARQGFRIVRGITTSTNTAWQQITTRRIVDYAKYGVRSAAEPYIGLLNNDRVRAALRATVNSFLAEMVLDEMLVSYELDVTATREEQRQGIARVTMVLRPTFSIDFIKVTMFLE